jgi:putative oxidoreductase
MIKRLFQTENEIAVLIMRLFLGVVFFPHGMQKLLGLYGGPGFLGSMNMFTSMGVPTIFAVLAILAEGLGSLGLLTGFLTRIAAFGVTTNMIVAIMMVHWQNGFFMNWMGNQKGEGFEFHLLAIGLGLALIIKGGGALSIDRAIYTSKKRPRY